jgi:hypothetical protein
LKIVGQGVVAVFCDPLACIRAALALPEQPFCKNVRLAAHRGPALVTTVNGRLEYFGQVMQALEAVALGTPRGSLGLSDAIVSDPGVVAMLSAMQSKLPLRRSDNGIWRVLPAREAA